MTEKHFRAAELALLAETEIRKLANAHAEKAQKAHHQSRKHRRIGHVVTSRIDRDEHIIHRSATLFYHRKGDEFRRDFGHHLATYERSKDPQQELSDEFIHDSFRAARESCETSEEAIRHARERNLEPGATLDWLHEQGEQVPFQRRHR